MYSKTNTTTRPNLDSSLWLPPNDVVDMSTSNLKLFDLNHLDTSTSDHNKETETSTCEHKNTPADLKPPAVRPRCRKLPENIKNAKNKLLSNYLDKATDLIQSNKKCKRRVKVEKSNSFWTFRKAFTKICSRQAQKSGHKHTISLDKSLNKVTRHTDRKMNHSLSNADIMLKRCQFRESSNSKHNFLEAKPDVKAIKSLNKVQSKHELTRKTSKTSTKPPAKFSEYNMNFDSMRFDQKRKADRTMRKSMVNLSSKRSKKRDDQFSGISNVKTLTIDLTRMTENTS